MDQEGPNFSFYTQDVISHCVCCMVSVILSKSSLYVILIIKLVTVHHVLIGGLASKEANIPTIIRNIETSSSNSFACQFFSALIITSHCSELNSSFSPSEKAS